MSEQPARRAWVLADNRTLRLFTVFVLYVAQGVPLGLFWFAIPAWMAAHGAGAEDVGYVLGLTSLPWTLKLINGFIMDRYTVLAMGRRRVWLIGAQLVMILLLVICALIQPGVDDVAILGAAGFVVNMATTFQDVAVDGMAVDIMPDEERARASGMMFGGQAIGMSLSATLSGAAIARLGPAAAYLLSAVFIGAVTTYVIFLNERRGERRLPWSAGDVHPRNRAIHVGAWAPILKHTVGSIVKPLSLLWIPVMLVTGFHYGMFAGITPLIGTDRLGWSEEAVTRVVGTAQFVAGIAGLTIGGWVGDRFGASRATIGMLLLYLVLSASMRLAVVSWGDPNVFMAFIYGWTAFDTLLTVVTQPISMRLCDPRVAATQFTLYMATSNFGITMGAWVLGASASLGGLPAMFVWVFAGHLLGLVLLLTVPYPRGEVADEVARQLPEGRGPVPVQD